MSELIKAESTALAGRTVEVIAAEINALTASMLSNIMEIGRRMCEAKELLGHGEFGEWIKTSTGYSTSTANNFMRIFKEYSAPQSSLFGPEANCQTFGNLSYSKALALLAVPAEEREEFAKTHSVDELSTRELQEAIRERDAEKAKADTARKEAAEAKRAKEASEIEAKRLRSEIEELKARPVEVAVQKADPKEIEEAVKKAVAAAEKEHKKELKEALNEATAAEKKSAELEKALKDAETKAAEAVKNNGFTEAEMYKREAEDLRKKLAMADPAVAEFKGLFAQAVDIVAKLKELLNKAGEDKKESLTRALTALRDQI